MRSWNVFHGNTSRRGARDRLRTMIRLATADRPGRPCLQEVRSGRCRASRAGAGCGALDRSHAASRGCRRRGSADAITRLNNGLFRSAIAGQANAILLGAARSSRSSTAPSGSTSSGREQRWCHAVRLERPRRREPPRVERLPPAASSPAAEVVRADDFVDASSRAACRASSRATSTCAPSTCASCPAGRRSAPGSTTCSCAASRRAALRLARGAPPSRLAACSRTTRRSRRGSDDVRGGARALPGARAHGVSERGHVRAARAADARRRSSASCAPRSSRDASARPYFERMLALRDERARRRSPRSSASSRRSVALTSLDHGRLQHRPRRPRARPGRRGRHDRRGALRPARARSTRAAPASSWCRPDADAILAAVDAADAPARALARALDDRPRPAGARAARAERACRSSSTAPSRSGAIPVDARGLDFYTVSGQKWLCGPDATGGLVVAEPERLRVAPPSYFSQAVATSRPGASSRARARRASTRTGSRRRRSPGSRPRSTLRRAGGSSARRSRRAAAASCSRRASSSSRPTRRSSRSAPSDPPALVARLAEQDVVVRDLPGTGLVRASCGWWTSDDDLERLVAGVAA